MTEGFHRYGRRADLTSCRRARDTRAHITRAFHLRAVCPEGAGRSPSAQRWKGFKCDGFLEHRARQVQTLVLPRPSWPRRRSAPPARRPNAIAAVLRHIELQRPPAAPRSRPFCSALLSIRGLRGERSFHAATVKKQLLALSTSRRAKRVEQTTARRQNAAAQLRAVKLEGARSAPSSLHFKET